MRLEDGGESQSSTGVRTLVTLSPVLPDRRSALVRRLRMVRYFPGLGRPLARLQFIHYARWTLLEDVPEADGSGRPRALRWSYLLFTSSYDGEFREYLDTFADVIPGRLSRLFGACFGFEQHVEETASGRPIDPAAFRSFVRANELEVLASHAAQPTTTVRTIRQALVLAERMRRMGGGADAPTGREVAQLVMGPQPPRSSLAQHLQATRTDWLRAVRDEYGVNPLTVLAPVARLDDLRALLEEGWPLDGVPGVHFARFAIVPPELQDLGQKSPDRLDTSYLLFVCDGFGAPGDLAEAIRTGAPDGADRVWGTCAGYPGARDRFAFHGWFRAHRRPTRYYVTGYPPRPAEAVVESVRARERLSDWIAERGRPSEQELREAVALAAREERGDGRA